MVMKGEHYQMMHEMPAIAMTASAAPHTDGCEPPPRTVALQDLPLETP